MTIEEMQEIRDAAKAKLERILEIEKKAEGRDTTRRERAEIERLTTEARALKAKLPKHDGSVFQPGARGGDKTIGDTLSPDQRVSDWLRQSGDYRSPASKLGDDDPANLSLGKMVRGAVTGNWRDAEAEQRAMSENVLADGGYALSPQLSARVIDRVRNNMAVMRLGATTVPLTTQTTYLGRLVGAADVSWKAEGDAISDSTPTFDRVVLNAQTLPILVKISAELFEDLSPAATDVIETEISQALALELDRAALRGSGMSPEPTGILNQSGVTITALGSGNGASPNWDNLVDAAAVVRGGNIEPDGMLFASRTDQSLSKLKDSQSRYLQPPVGIADIPRVVSNQVPTNLTVGTSHDCSEIYVGRWSDVLVGIRTDKRFNIRVLNERFIDNLQYAFLAYIRADIGLAHPAAFNVVTGVRP